MASRLGFPSNLGKLSPGWWGSGFLLSGLQTLSQVRVPLVFLFLYDSQNPLSFKMEKNIFVKMHCPWDDGVACMQSPPEFWLLKCKVL